MRASILSWFRREDPEKAALRAELAEAKAAANFLAGSIPGLGQTDIQVGNAAQQLAHNRGWVYACVRLISQRIAGQPIHLARKKGKALEPIEQHPILDALADPNPFTTSWSLMVSCAASLELVGRAYIWLSDAPDGRLQLYYLPSNWVEPVHDAKHFARYIVRPDGNPNHFTVDGDDMVRIYYPDPRNPLHGLSPVQAIAQAIAVDEDISTCQRRSFGNPHPGLMLIAGRLPAQPGAQGVRPTFTPEQKQRLIASIRQAYSGVHHYGDPIILDSLIEKIEKLSNTPHEMDFLNSSKMSKARILQGFGVNEILLGEIEGANRASAVVAEDSFCSNTINPICRLISECLTEWLAKRYDPNFVLYIEPARAKDPEQEREDWKLLAQAGAVTKDELRQWKGLAPAKGGSEFVQMAAQSKEAGLARLNFLGAEKSGGLE